MSVLVLHCHLDRTHALIFTDILVTPFFSVTETDRACLDDLFSEGHLPSGNYCLAGYPDKGPRAIMKIGFADDLSVYASDIDDRTAADALYLEPGTALVSSILDLIKSRRGVRTKVAEVWWFHASPTSEQEWHSFMKNLAHQSNEQIFFVPVKPKRSIGPLDFRKPKGSNHVTLSMELL